MNEILPKTKAHFIILWCQAQVLDETEQTKGKIKCEMLKRDIMSRNVQK